jgi:hypothetical protein
MSIQVYLDLLQFFAYAWNIVERKMKKYTKRIRKIALPEPKDPHFITHMSGTAEYQRWFDDVFFICRQYSTEVVPAPYLHLQRAGKSLQLDPNVMRQLAADAKNLILALRCAGYTFSTLCDYSSDDSDDN